MLAKAPAVLRRFLRDETGLSPVERGLLFCFLVVWCVVALDETGLLPRPL
jgi:Flp pilus assembly pilin Flp